MAPPNILFFFTDQQRWDTCGCYRRNPAALDPATKKPIETTPNLDRAARDGVRFENAFTCQPVCGPARAAIQTGRYPAEVGCHTNHRMLPIDEPTIAKLLSERGYETAYIGKWHLASCGPEDGPDDFRTRPVPPERRGGYRDFWLASDVLEFTSHSYDGHMFDGEGNRRGFPSGRYRADAVTDWALAYLDGRGGDAGNRAHPFFLFVSYIEPHHQNDHAHYEGPRGARGRFAGFVPPGDLAPLQGDWREEYPDYLGCIHSLDHNLGRFRRKLSDLGLADNTLLIFASDHGSHFCTRNDEYKRSCHDGCIRIPLVMTGPGFTGGRVLRPLVSLIDLAPTILTAAGVEPPSFMRGRPLQALTRGTPSDWPREVFLQISESQCGRAIRTDRWKYSVRAPDKGGFDPAAELYAEDFLYDLHADPFEQTNLAASSAHASVRAELADVLKRRMAAAGEEVPRIVPAREATA